MSATSLVPYQAKKKPTTQCAIDNHTDIYQPLDYSFCSLEKFNDAVKEEPRVPLSPRGKGKNKQTDETDGKGRYNGQSIKLNNNNFTNFEGFLKFIDDKFVTRVNVGWIDLSQNELVKVNAEITEFENLQILYLHGNAIADLAEVEMLIPLRRLDKLTLHGNPVENTKNYRSIVLTMLPQLKSLDFSRVTKGDRRTSTFLGNKITKKKKKSDEDED